MFKGLEHTAIASPDTRRLAQWYVDHLEFSIIYEHNTTFFVQAPNGTLIEIIASEGTPSPQPLRAPGIRHLAILVDDFDAAYASLRASGVEFATEPAASGGNRVAFFRDPDGNLLHILHREKPLV